jgi:hypothetical protein
MLATKSPPAMRTLPEGSRLLDGAYRGVPMDPVAANVPLVGSYSSALLRLAWLTL